MSESTAKPRTMIDLDEFERRLRRPPTASAAPGDPLAELARLVGGGQQDPFESVFNQPPLERREPAAPRHDDRWDAREPAAQQSQPVSQRHPLAGNFAAIEAGLRGTLPPEPGDFSAVDERFASPQKVLASPSHNAPEGNEHEQEADGQADPYVDVAAMDDSVRPRSRRPLYITALIILVGLGGIGASFAFKGHSVSPLEIATIKAADGPTKVQAIAATDERDQNGSLLDKGPQAAPLALVNRAEQPVDLSRSDLPQSGPPMRVVGLGNPQIVSNAATVPVPPSPGQATTNTVPPAFGPTDVIEPKKVKTISVRPDGTLLPADAATQAPENVIPVPPPVPNPVTTKVVTPKTPTRVVTTPKAQVPPDSNKTAAQDDPGKAQDSSGTIRQQQAQTRPLKVATAETDTSDTAGKSGFAVQLAAPGTEEEARQSANRLAKQFGGVLGGYHLTYHRATVNDKSVFRVRAGGLASFDEAKALCDKIKAAGGSCFATKN
jgi:SPOR domain